MPFPPKPLVRLGYEAEADAFRRFIERSAAGSARDPQVRDGVGGEPPAARIARGGAPELSAFMTSGASLQQSRPSLPPSAV